MPNFIRGMMGDSGTALVEVENSALYVDGNSEFLVRTLSGAGTSRKTFTLGGWFYKTKVGSGSDCRIFQWDNGSTNIDRGMILIDNTTPDAIKLLIEDASDVATMIWTTTQLIRDQAWYHWCLTVDTTPATPIFKFFLNNEEITAWTKGTDTIAQDDVFTIVDSGARQAWGSAPEGTGYFDGYMAECFLLDGQVVTDATDFVDVSDDGLYVTPKSNTAMKALTFGDEGFYLDNVTNAQTDASGNGNNFTNTNTVTLSKHTMTNLENRWNPLWYTTGQTLSNGNKSGQVTNSGNQTITSTLTLPSTGKWYIELDCDTETYAILGLLNANGSGGELPFNQGSTARGYYQACELYGYYSYDGKLFTEGTGSGGNSASYGTAYDNTDYIGIAADCDNGNLFFSNSGTWQNSATAGEIAAGTGTNAATTNLDNEYVVALFGAGSTEKFTFVDEADWSGTAPTGFIALTTTNIAAETTRTASDTTKYFDTILYEGNGAGQRVGQFQPFGNAFTVGNGSLFVEANTEHFTRTPAGAGSLVTWTLSTWVKRGDLGRANYFLGTNDGGKNMSAGFVADNTLYWQLGTGDSWSGPNTVHMALWSNQVYKDPSQWIHLVFKYDSTASTPSASGIAMYVNGVQVTSLQTATYPAQNYASGWNSANEMLIGAVYNTATGEQNMDGYLAETVFIDGQALEPTSFGQTDTSTNRWIPRSVTGLTYGTNGFYLDYSNASDLGEDQAGSNDWTNVNTVTQSTDSPTINASVLNPNNASATAPVLSNGNRAGNAGGDTGNHRSVVGTLLMPANNGKFYWEMTSAGPDGVHQESTGIVAQTAPGYPIVPAYGAEVGASSTRSYSLQTNGKKLGLGTYTVSYATAYTAGVVIGVGYDSDNGILKFWRANSDLGNAFTGIDTSWDYAPAISSLGSGTYTYAFAEGDLTYSIPTGYKTLIQDNITSSDQFISAFSWIKNRDATDNHMLFDRVRGATKDIHSNDMVDEVTNVETVQSFLAGGVQVGSDVEVNTANESYALWNWMMEATGSGASNEDGSINTTSTLVDTTLGMSISTYTGTGANATIGHGLGVAPEWVMFKCLDSGGSTQWLVYHSALGGTKTLFLDTTGAAATAIGYFNNTDPTSSVVTLGTNAYLNNSGNKYVAYCFAPSQFISIGSWTGNTDNDGPMVIMTNSLGIPISPTWILFKRSSTAGQNWQIIDRSINPYNAAQYSLPPNTTAAQTDWGSPPALDFVTGGIKVRVNNTTINSGTVIYMAIGTPIIDTDGRIIAGR